MPDDHWFQGGDTCRSLPTPARPAAADSVKQWIENASDKGKTLTMPVLFFKQEPHKAMHFRSGSAVDRQPLHWV